MPATDQKYEVRVRVEDDTHGIYVGLETIAAIQAEAMKQIDNFLPDVTEAWADFDVTDIEAIKALQFKVAMVASALSTLMYAAPIPDEDPGEQ